MSRYPVERLRTFIESVFLAVGALGEHAAVVADRLIEADLRGRTGHGLMRVRPFAERAIAGGINLRPNIVLAGETPVSAVVDGDNGLGPVVMTMAAEVAIGKAKESGLAWVGTRRSNHAGAAGVYTALALREDLIGIYFAVAAGNVMPPWGGRQRLLGTNPLAVALPAGKEVPFQLDIATTVASHGTIRVLEALGEPMPEGWVVDPQGRPITDPALAHEGFLVPIGGYKGAGLNFVIGALAGIMNGAAFGSEVVGASHPLNTPTNTGQAMLVMRPDLFLELEQYRGEMDRQLREFRASESMTDEPVRLPGERAAQLEAQQRLQGILLPEPLRADLNALAAKLGLADRLDLAD
ncbi:MAG: Ldh family oxidoreductase [Acidimicrobiia bacterium]|nr:Ldh family oxidoreductase [Acidimicrobiia bacterium]